MAVGERFNKIVDIIETRWALAAHIVSGVTLMASAGIPAWATWAYGYFSAWAPLSWMGAAFVGAMCWAIVRILMAQAFRIRVRAKYDARFAEHGGDYNPLDSIFERRRIYLNDFSLPSHPIIEGKTFVDCEIIGPANVYWHLNNSAFPLRAPIIDAIILSPEAKFTNGFIFQNCIFRNCSFQRITVFGGAEYFPDWKANTNLNLIGVAPSEEQITLRKNLLTPTPEAKVIEHSEPENAAKPPQ